jgi:preprotein translocase subunit Sss1
MTWRDHVYVVAVLLIVFSVGGAWAYRRFIARTPKPGEDELVREYKILLVGHRSLFAPVVMHALLDISAMTTAFIVLSRNPPVEASAFVRA